MAHVTAGNSDPTPAQVTEDGDRGQLILVTALGLAMLFVALALILNTAIYTENLASRSGDIGGGTDAVRYQDATRDAVGGLIGYVNAHNRTSHETLQSNLSAGVAAFRNHSGRLFAGSGRAVETQLVSTVNGSRIEQDDGTRNFTDTTGDGNWTVVTGVDHTRAFTINVSRSALDPLSGLPFTIVVDDGGATWQMTITRDGNDIVIQADGANCRTTAASAWINVTAGTVAGSECDGLSFADGVTGTYDMTYENASNSQGTYRLVADQETVADSPGPHLVEDGGGQPFVAHAIYSANVSVEYETPRLFYRSTERIAPGERDG